ncbi:transposable element Tcb1 transposase [Trichonephila clavipes]|nr:transposable element Tcb1 transposase [Trichonephila clavipes]
MVLTDESRFYIQLLDGRIRVWRHRGERLLNCCIMHRHTGPAPDIMVWSGIRFHFRTPLGHIPCTPNSQRCISEVLKSMLLLYIQHVPSAIFQQHNAPSHRARNAQEFIFILQIQLLPWPACSPDLSPIENVWSILAQ